MAAEDNSPIYDDLMRFKPDGLTANAWAVLAGVSRTVWADMRRHGNPSRRTLEKLLTAAGSSLAEFEALRLTAVSTAEHHAALALSDRRATPWSPSHLPPLSLFATDAGGEWGDPARMIALTILRTGKLLGRVARPASHAPDASANAVTILGESRYPRFRPGRVVAVSQQASVAIGDDVLIRLTAPALHATGPGTVPVLIKELACRSARGLELRQFNPDVSFEVRADEVVSVEKVLGELV